MQVNIRWLTVLVLLGAALGASAATGKVIKVLPHLLDQQGRHSISPSLYDRDAYQDHLRKHPELRSGLRFDIQWKASRSAALKLKVEARAMKNDRPQTKVWEVPVPKASAFSRWTSVPITGQEYRELGEISAWRVTLWDGESLLGEQSSFLWAGGQAGPGKP